MRSNHETISLAETPLRKIMNAKHAFRTTIEAHVQKIAASEIRSDANYEATLAFFAQATDCALRMQAGEDARALVYFSSVCECILAIGHLYRNDDLIKLSKTIRLGIQHHLNTNQQLFDDYLQVSLISEITRKQKTARQFTTGSHFATSSMSVASLADPIIAPFANHPDTRERLANANAVLNISQINLRLPYQVSRFRLNTEHGQSINVFRAEIFKPNAQEIQPLYVITIHGNASCAAGEFPFRLMEMDNFLARSNADRIVLLTPDLPGSIASGGYANSLGEISQNSVQKLVTQLLQQGIDPSQIVVRGHSLGGLISTHAVHTLNKAGIKVSLISVDSLAQTQKFLPKALAPIAGQLALKHFDAPAFKFFDELDANRRFCIHKMGDQVIPPSCSVMFHLPGNTLDNGVAKVTREDCFLIEDPKMDHNNDIVVLDENPCITALMQIHRDRNANQKVLFDTFCAKLTTGIQAFNAYCEKHTKCIQFGRVLMEELPILIQNLQDGNQKIIDRLQVLLGWIIHRYNLILPEYQTEAARRFLNKESPFITFCTNMTNFAKQHPVLNMLVQNIESEAQCVSVYQTTLQQVEHILDEQPML